MNIFVEEVVEKRGRDRERRKKKMPVDDYQRKQFKYLYDLKVNPKEMRIVWSSFILIFLSGLNSLNKNTRIHAVFFLNLTETFS